VEPIKKFELSKEYLERLQTGIAASDTAYILDSLDGVNVADIAAILDELETSESIYVLRLMEGQLAADIVIELYDTTLEKVLQELEIKEIASWIQLMDSDDGADIISLFSEKEREEVIAEIDDRIKLEQILELLRYEEDTAGGIMAKEFIRANKNWNVVQTINEIRRQAENVEKFYSIYVVNNKQQLLGRVSLKKIILSASETTIESIMEDEVISVPVYMDQEEVASLMRKYDLESVPVVNAKNKLVGRITVDDILDVVQEEAEEDIQAMAGVSADNVGIQASSLIVQSLASKSAFDDTPWQRFFKGFLVALLNGLVLGIFVFLVVAYVYGFEPVFGITVGVALFCVVLLSSFMGTVTPLVLHHFGINPAIASGPFITTTNDLIGLAVYFGVAMLLLNL